MYHKNYDNLKQFAKERFISNIKLYPTTLFSKLVPKNDLKDYFISY